MKILGSVTRAGATVVLVTLLAMGGFVHADRPPSSPLEIPGVVVWFDADDAGTVQRRMTWDDKSPNSRQATGIGPRYVANAINGKPAIRFEGEDDLLFPTPTTLEANDAKSVFGVFKGATPAGAYDFVLSTRLNYVVNNNNNGYILSFASAGRYAHTGASESRSAADSISRGSAVVAGCTTAANSTEGDVAFFANGSELAADPTGTLGAASPELVGGYTAIGRQSINYGAGDLGELVCVSGVISEPDRQKLEGYLAHKWGLAGELPGGVDGHPYKNSPPEGWDPSDLANLEIWLDADDADTVDESDPAVAAWLDKSGGGYHASHTNAAQRPDYVTGAINGKSAIQFYPTAGGKEALAFLTPTTLEANDAKSIFCVFKGIILDTYYDFMLATRVNYGGVNNGSNGYFLDITSRCRLWHANAPAIITDDDIVRGDACLHASLIQANGADADFFAYGSPQTIATDTLAAATAENANGYTVIAQQGGGYGAVDVAEIVCVAGVVSEDNRQKLEGYLALKWGLTDKLPAGHPYKMKSGTLVLLR